MASQSESFEIVRDARAFAALEEDWNALLTRASGYRLSQSFPWCSAAWEILAAPRGRRLHCLVMRRAGRIVLVWPLALERRALCSFAAQIGWETTEYSDVLVEDGPDAERRVEAAWRRLRESSRADVIALPNIRTESRLYRALAATRAPSTLRSEPSPWLSPEGYRDWESYMRSLSRDFRSELARKRRRLGELGKLTFEVVTDGAAREEILRWTVSQKRDWLVRLKERVSWLASREMENFLAAMLSRGAPAGAFAVMAMKLDGRLIASQICGVDKVRMEGQVGAFDVAYNKYSPGQVLLEYCLKWAFEQGLAVDFRMGSHPYKRTWTNRDGEAVSCEIANSPLGAAYVLWRKSVAAARAARRRLTGLVPPAWRREIKRALGMAAPQRPGAG